MPKMLFKHGTKSTMPKLDFREPAITDDTEEVFVGGNTQNIQLAKQTDLDTTNTNVGQKADKNYVDTQLGYKANQSDLDTTNQNVSANAAQLAQMEQHQVIQNTVADTQGPLDLKNFAGQGTGGTNPIGLVLHNYNDGGAVQFDNVGTGKVLTLVNAHNSTNRADKDANYVGTGDFLDLMEYSVSAGTNLYVFLIDKDTQQVWTGIKGTAKFLQMKSDDGTPAYQYKVQNQHGELFNFANSLKNVLHIKNDVAVNSVYTRAVVESDIGQDNGLFLHATNGPVTIGSDNNYIYVNNLIKSTSDNLFLIGSTGTSSVEVLNPLKLPSYNSANAQNNTIFIDSSNGKLTCKDSTGALHALW